MTMHKPHLVVPLAIALALCLVWHPSDASARASAAARPAARAVTYIDQSPSDVRASARHACAERSNANRAFASYVDDEKPVRVNFEHYDCRAQ